MRIGAAIVPLLAIACTPKPEPDLPTGFSMVAAMMHTCIADAQGVLRCSGANDKGELGDGTTTDRLEAVVIDVGGPVARVAGEDPLCALLTSGEVRCWGDPSWGGIGDGANQRRDRPSKVLGLPRAIAIAGSGTRNCAITSDGAVYCWGRDPELDGREERSVLLPERVEIPPVVEIGVGYSHACARTKEGRVLCWGRNNWGQLGDGTTVDRAAPAEIDGLEAVELAIGSFHGCARTADGRVLCWGRDMDVRGAPIQPDGDHTTGPHPRPVAGVTDVVQLAASGDHACALTRAAAVFCWGNNGDGQLGEEPREWPMPFAKELPSLSGATFIAAGPWRTCARMPDDTITCLGRTFIGKDGTKPRTRVLAPPGLAPTD